MSDPENCLDGLATEINKPVNGFDKYHKKTDFDHLHISSSITNPVKGFYNTNSVQTNGCCYNVPNMPDSLHAKSENCKLEFNTIKTSEATNDSIKFQSLDYDASCAISLESETLHKSDNNVSKYNSVDDCDESDVSDFDDFQSAVHIDNSDKVCFENETSHDDLLTEDWAVFKDSASDIREDWNAFKNTEDHCSWDSLQNFDEAHEKVELTDDHLCILADETSKKLLVSQVS